MVKLTAFWCDAISAVYQPTGSIFATTGGNVSLVLSMKLDLTAASTNGCDGRRWTISLHYEVAFDISVLWIRNLNLPALISIIADFISRLFHFGFCFELWAGTVWTACSENYRFQFQNEICLDFEYAAVCWGWSWSSSISFVSNWLDVSPFRSSKMPPTSRADNLTSVRRCWQSHHYLFTSDWQRFAHLSESPSTRAGRLSCTAGVAHTACLTGSASCGIVPYIACFGWT